jgi:hypothetical protein
MLSFALDEVVPHLLGMTLQPTSDMPPIPGSGAGRSFVSLKFWQVKATTDDYLRQAEAVQKVVRIVKDAGPIEAQAPWPATITVVEMVTIVPSVTSGPQGDPFLRCLTCLIDVVDAYRISENARMARISYERIGPVILSYHRSLTAPYRWWGPTAMMLDHVNVKVADPEQLDVDRLDRLLKILRNLRAGQPFAAWSELCRDRDYAFHIEGDYRRTVIQAALAVEVLVSSVIACLLWEEAFPNTPTEANLKTAATLLAKDAAPLRAELGKRIGGNWGSNASPSAVWQVHGAQMRNQVVHLGHRPTKQEAAQAIQAAVDLDRHIRKRLAVTATKHHRTAAMLLGEPGLERLGAMSRKLRVLLDQSASEPDWVHSYLEWRRDASRTALAGSDGA